MSTFIELPSQAQEFARTITFHGEEIELGRGTIGITSRGKVDGVVVTADRYATMTIEQAMQIDPVLFATLDSTLRKVCDLIWNHKPEVIGDKELQA
jgi:PHD/YefM family antitoxin component YafN of YafNO toxin-antitoxin module